MWMRLKRRLHVALTIFYFALMLSFIFATFVAYGLGFAAPIESPPKGPIDAGAGPRNGAVIDNTNVVVDYPRQTIDVRVTLMVNQTDKYFIYVLLPYTIRCFIVWNL
jgi:hypothetical protein